MTSATVPTVIAKGSTVKLDVLEHPSTITCTVAVPFAMGVRTPVLGLIEAKLEPLFIAHVVVPVAPVAVKVTGEPIQDERVPAITGVGLTVMAVTPTQPLLSVKVRLAVPKAIGLIFTELPLAGLRVKIPALLETHGFELAGVDIVDATMFGLAKQTDTDGLEGPPMKVVGKAFTVPVPVATFLVDAPAETHAIFPESPLLLVFILT